MWMLAFMCSPLENIEVASTLIYLLGSLFETLQPLFFPLGLEQLEGFPRFTSTAQQSFYRLRTASCFNDIGCISFEKRNFMHSANPIGALLSELMEWSSADDTLLVTKRD